VFSQNFSVLFFKTKFVCYGGQKKRVRLNWNVGVVKNRPISANWFKISGNNRTKAPTCPIEKPD